MYIKRIKRICGVRGCKNTETFILSRTREVGGSVVMCKSCIEEAFEAVKNYKEPVRKKNEGIPPLFFNRPIQKEIKKEFICSECQKIFETEKGLKMHMKSHTQTET